MKRKKEEKDIKKKTRNRKGKRNRNKKRKRERNRKGNMIFWGEGPCGNKI